MENTTVDTTYDVQIKSGGPIGLEVISSSEPKEEENPYEVYIKSGGPFGL